MPQPRIFPLGLSALAGMLLMPAAVLAQFSGAAGNEGSSLPAICNVDVRTRRAGPSPNRANEPFYLNAEEADLQRFGESLFVGDVLLERADQRLATRRLIYDRSIGQVVAPEALRYSDQDYIIEAANAIYYLDDANAELVDVDFKVAGSTANGKAMRVFLEQGGVARVTSAEFTTCPGDDPAWELSASRIKLDQEKGVGVARNAVLRFQNVPIFYTPYISFPLDDRRKSGFLYPSLSTTSDNGFGISIPYYWNIQPNMDATITPRLLSDRGAALGLEYRYLTRRSAGTLDADYLPDDDKRNNSDRYRLRARASYRLASRWNARMDLRHISDDDYFLDFGGNINETTIPFLRSSLIVAGSGQFWNLRLTADAFNSLDSNRNPASEPFDRLPRVELDARWPLLRDVDVTLDAEAVYFSRGIGPTGARLDILPALEWRFEQPGWYVAPKLAYRLTSYVLEETEGTDFDTDDNPSRALPIITFDTGMVFEKRLRSGNRWTLEPRLFYAYVPFEDQSDIPDFDTSLLTFGLSQIFTPNRFAGADRQAEANQLSWGLTSRFIDLDSGRQYLDFTVAQTFFFRDQRVTLPNQQPTEFDSSPVLAEVNWRPFSNWAATAGLQYDPEDEEVDVGLLGINYQNAQNLRVQASYRFRRGQVDQFDIRVRYPVSRNWRLLGRLNYSIRDDTTLETVLGFEYESCCWALQLIGRQFVNARDGGDQTGVFLELHLKGLGSIGRNPYELFGINQSQF